MASSLTKMRMLAFFPTTATSPHRLGLGFPSLRHFSFDVRVLDPIVKEIQNQTNIVDHSVVKLETSFANSSTRVGSGVFVRPWVLVTSAHVVGRVAGFNCEVGRTAVTTSGGKVLRTRPLAVNFGGDVAVLHAVGDADTMPPPSPLAYDDDGCKELPLTVLTRHESCTDLGSFQMKVREFEDTRPRREWANPVGDDFGWARYGGQPYETIPIYPGSPWFNLVPEVVGIASWAVGKEPYASVGSFVVPPPRIRAVLDYAANKGDHVRIVMDYWIEKVTTVAVDGCDDHIIGKECDTYVPLGFIATMYLPESLKAEIVKNINDEFKTEIVK